MLSIESLEVAYGVIPALKRISLHVGQGEIVALIGANGAGKTTTLKSISGLCRPRGGDIRFKGQSIIGKPVHELVKMGISHVPEGRGIFPNLTVLENLTLGAYSRKPKKDLELDLGNVFEKFPRLKERKTQMGGTLSGGEQQMLAIGRALMSRPQLMLLDEPSMGLAPFLVPEIFKIIEEINRAGTTILLIEQNANMALKTAHRAYVIETGEIVMDGKAGDLASNEEIKKAYLGY